MKLQSIIAGLSLGMIGSVLAAPAPAPIPEDPAPATVDPTAVQVEERAIRVDVATPEGTVTGSSLLNVESFRGIPFAEPPVGQLRLKPPKRVTSIGSFDARGIAPSCPQMFVSSGATDLLSGLLGGFLDLPFLKVVNGQEDCLSVTVQRPAGTKPGAKLPVLVWIFGGGFELGSTAMYDGTSLLKTGVDQGQPFIYVAINYRVAGFGFLPGAEVLKDGSANLGLLDQRMGLEWVADNVSAFGGDPDKVTIWGESAGAISVFDQMILYGGDANYKGKPLFRAGIMNSGSAIPAEPVDGAKGQAIYDAVVTRAGCAGAQDSLDCLRQLSYDKFLDAANSVPGLLSYNSLALSYLPRPDGTAIPDSPENLIVAGRYHAVPMIIGNQEDEGTLFSIFQPNLTRADDIVDYLQSLYFKLATRDQLKTLVNLYPSSITAGSPFRTGIFNELRPNFKRLAAILGDLGFSLTRRIFLDTAAKVNPDVPSWSYLSSYNFGVPILGTFHGSDLLQVFYGILPNNAMRSTRTYYFNFLYNLDPNKGVTRYAKWPKWKDNKEMMWFKTGNSNDIVKDDFRTPQYNWISNNVGALHI